MTIRKVPTPLTFTVASLKDRRFAGWLLFVSLAIHAPITLAAIFYSKLPNSDFDNYYDIGTRPGRPYVDFPVEFPLATAQTFRTLAPLAGDRDRFGVNLVIISADADLAIVVPSCGPGESRQRPATRLS